MIEQLALALVEKDDGIIPLRSLLASERIKVSRMTSQVPPPHEILPQYLVNITTSPKNYYIFFLQKKQYSSSKKKDIDFRRRSKCNGFI